MNVNEQGGISKTPRRFRVRASVQLHLVTTRNNRDAAQRGTRGLPAAENTYFYMAETLDRPGPSAARDQM